MLAAEDAAVNERGMALPVLEFSVSGKERGTKQLIIQLKIELQRNKCHRRRKAFRENVYVRALTRCQC